MGIYCVIVWIANNSCIKCERDSYRAHMSKQVLSSPLTCLKDGPYKGFLTSFVWIASNLDSKCERVLIESTCPNKFWTVNSPA